MKNLHLIIQKIFSFINSDFFWKKIIPGLGIILAIFFYLLSNNTREPVYSIIKEPTIIFSNTSTSSKFKLILTDSTPINNNVYVTTIALWNNGDLEIKKEDIRKKIKVVTSHNGRILDFKITKQSHPDIANFRLEEEDNELIVNWDYFDPKFGFEFQVIYSGSKNSQINLEGYTLGSKVKKVSLLSSSMLPIIQHAFYIFICSYAGFVMFKISKGREKTPKILLILLFLLVIYYSYNLLMNFYSGYTTPF